MKSDTPLYRVWTCPNCGTANMDDLWLSRFLLCSDCNCETDWQSTFNEAELAEIELAMSELETSEDIRYPRFDCDTDDGIRLTVLCFGNYAHCIIQVPTVDGQLSLEGTLQFGDPDRLWFAIQSGIDRTVTPLKTVRNSVTTNDWSKTASPA